MNKKPWLARLTSLAIASVGWTLLFWFIDIHADSSHETTVKLTTSGDAASILAAVNALHLENVKVDVDPPTNFTAGLIAMFITGLFFLTGLLLLSYRIVRDCTRRFFEWE